MRNQRPCWDASLQTCMITCLSRVISSIQTSSARTSTQYWHSFLWICSSSFQKWPTATSCSLLFWSWWRSVLEWQSFHWFPFWLSLGYRWLRTSLKIEHGTSPIKKRTTGRLTVPDLWSAGLKTFSQEKSGSDSLSRFTTMRISLVTCSSSILHCQKVSATSKRRDWTVKLTLSKRFRDLNLSS